MRQEQQNQGRPVRRKKTEQGMSRVEIWKYAVSFMLLVYIVLILMYTSGSTKPFEQVVHSMQSGLNMENLKERSAQDLKRYYGLNSADYEGVMLYTSRNSISAEEVLMVKVKNDKQVQKLRDAIRERIEERTYIFENISPDQVPLLDRAGIMVRGRYVFFTISADAQKYRELFANSL